MDSNQKTAWWAIARSEEVGGKKPINADIGDQPIVLWRDNEGIVRALEDRCPHRRAPLSLGCVRDNGWIQCGYHGWIYEGETGRLKEIPNMKDKQKFPPLYRAIRFGVHESGGFVYVNLDAEAAPPAPSTNTTYALSGTVAVALSHQDWLDALFDDPNLVLAIRGIGFTPYLMTELHEEQGRLVMERSCQWRLLHWPAPFSPEFPVTMLTATDPITGHTDVTLRDADFNELLRVALAPVPAARGVTQIRWRAEIGENRPGWMAKLLGMKDSFAVRPSVDGAALRVLKPSASRHGEELRANMLNKDAVAAA